MNSLAAGRALLSADLRNIRRDTLLRFLLLYPLLIGLALRFLIPFVEPRLRSLYDIHPLYPLLVSFFGLVIMPALGGLVIGFLLLDERDAGTLTALQVTPLPMRTYLGYRVLFPMIWSVLAVYIIVPLMGLLPLQPLALLPLALLASLAAPIFALIFISFAANKVQGLALMKAISLFMAGPFIAWFVPEPWQYLFGIFPTYWPLKAYWEMAAGNSPWPWLAIGLIVNLAYLIPLLARVNHSLYRTSA